MRYKLPFYLGTCLLILACGVVTVMPPVVSKDKLIYTSEVATMQEPTDAPTETVRQMTVCNSSGLNVRAQAGTDNDVVAVLEDNNIVILSGDTVTITVIAWYEITSPVRGWVFSKYLCP